MMLDLVHPFDTFRELERAQRRLEAWFEPGVRAATAVPRFQVTEEDQAFALRADVPGAQASDLTIEAEGDALTVRLQTREPAEDGWTLRHVERARGSFTRTFRFPFVIDPSGVQAALTDGVLTVRVAKTLVTRTTIAVQA